MITAIEHVHVIMGEAAPYGKAQRLPPGGVRATMVDSAAARLIHPTPARGSMIQRRKHDVDVCDRRGLMLCCAVSTSVCC